MTKSEKDIEDSEEESKVIEGDGPKRVVKSEEEYEEEPEYGVTD